MRYKFTTSFSDLNAGSLLSQFNHFGRVNFPIGQVKPQQSPNLVKTLKPSSSRVQMNAAPSFDVLHQKQVRMAAHKNIGLVDTESTADALCVTAWPATNVGHPNAATLAFDVLMFGEITAHEVVVDVAINSHQGHDGSNGIGHLEIANVSSMPHLVTRGEVMQDAVIDVAVGVADESNTHKTNFVPVVRFAPSWRSANAQTVTMIRMRIVLMLFLVSLVPQFSVAQPGPRFHTESKKAIKLYRRAMEMSRAAMVPGAATEDAKQQVEEDLRKALELDPNFAEAERVLAALDYDRGAFIESRDHYAHYLSRFGEDWIRDHFSWAESARFALDPSGMKGAMKAMSQIPGVAEGPDVDAIAAVFKDAEFMEGALANPVLLDSEVLPPPVSTRDDEYFPSVWLAGEALVFTRRVEDARYHQGQEDLYVAQREGSGWSAPEPLRGLNTLSNEGAAALSGDGMTICYTVCRDTDRSGEDAHKGSCDLYIAQRNEQGWEQPVNLSAVNTAAWESQPCLSPDGQQLFFTRGAGRAGRRKYDLFTARRQSDGSWGQAFRMGGEVNSNGKEMRPFIHPDGQHFYFASDGRTGMGGMDLFVCTLMDNGKWGSPVNLGWPINTPEDESGLVVSSDGVTGFFSRSEDGQLDIHELILPPNVAAQATSAMEGRLSSASGVPLQAALIRLVDSDSGTPFAEAIAAADGSYHVPVPLDRAFVVMAEAAGHMLLSERIEQGEIEGRVARNFVLDPLQAGSEAVLKNVFFESGSAMLNPTSNVELERVGSWLAAQPHLIMEVGGHTDDVGTQSENMILSEQRAEAVKTALQQAGVQERQLIAKGYGQSKPAVTGTSEEARQQNRRTTLMVLPAR